MRAYSDLTPEEKAELKSSYFYQLQDDDPEVLGDEIQSPDQIPDDAVENHYDGVLFSEDDFFCNQ